MELRVEIRRAAVYWRSGVLLSTTLVIAGSLSPGRWVVSEADAGPTSSSEYAARGPRLKCSFRDIRKGIVPRAGRK